MIRADDIGFPVEQGSIVRTVEYYRVPGRYFDGQETDPDMERTVTFRCSRCELGRLWQDRYHHRSMQADLLAELQNHDCDAELQKNYEITKELLND